MNAVQTTNEVVRSNVSLNDDNTTEKKSQGYVRKKPSHPSKNIALLLYPDCDGHAVALAKVMSKWDYTYILHDKDEFETEDVDMHGGTSDGDILTEEDTERLKKKHYHVLIHLPMKKEATQVAKELKLEQRFVQRISDRTAMLCYLIHTGMYDKYQYKPEEVHSNRPSLFREALNSVSTDSEKLEKMIRIIQNKKCVSVDFALLMLAKEGMTQFALKHYSVVRDIVECVRSDVYRIMYPPTTLQTQLKERALREYRSDQVEMLSSGDDLPF